MIYTATFNPALDYIVTVPDYREGAVNKSAAEKISAGGKGINVSIVLNNMGIESTALGFIAGFTGARIREILDNMGVCTEFLELGAGESRINVKIKAAAETEINARGPEMDAAALSAFYKKLDKLTRGDILVLAGSIPASMPDTTYCDIMAALDGHGVKIIVDATGELLVKTLEYKPFLVKPNHHELGEIFGVQIDTRSEALEYAERLREMGARNVLVSMAGAGAVFAGENGERYEFSAPCGTVVNSTGAGDATVAGFIAAYSRTGDYRRAVMTGIAAGSASAFSPELATQAEIEAILKRME